MNAKMSVFVVCVEAIIYLSLYDLHDFTYKHAVSLTFTVCVNVKSVNIKLP